MTVALSLEGVVKTFGPTRALDGLDLQAAHRRGARLPGSERCGQDGDHPDPAGAAAPGQRVGARCSAATPGATRSSCTAASPTCPASSNLWPQLSGGEVIDLLGRLQGGLDPARRDELVDRFDLDVRRKSRTYSKGNRQKVALVAALAADVDLYLLDEPTAGLDPLMEAVFQDCVEELAAAGAHRAAVEPHPRPGRAALRPGHDHPPGPDDAVGHAGRAAPPDPHHRVGRRPRGPSPTWTGWPACTTWWPRTGGSPSTWTATRWTPVMRHLAEHGITSLTSHPADPRGAVPAPLRRRARTRPGSRPTAAGHRAREPVPAFVDPDGHVPRWYVSTCALDRVRMPVWAPS